MKISYNWLQSYFEEKLPEPEKLAERITFSFAEIEGVEKHGEDTILDIKILPDRACYTLSHRGVAREVSAILGIKMKEMNWPQPSVVPVRALTVSVEEPTVVPRYTARVIEGINPKASPWTKEHLEAIGQRSIGTVVDGANIVMFDMGQPLHAFDADKIEGGIVVRFARQGEKITTLDNKEVTLDESVLIIADEKDPLAIAGIKGGKKAEVTGATQNLILESAIFDASLVRKTSERLGIRTDASKRFENKLAVESALLGMKDFTAYLFETDKAIKVGEIVDVLNAEEKSTVIEITAEFICQRLGVEISKEAIKDILLKLSIVVDDSGDVWKLTPPARRLDLVIPEDMVEEVGRILGYDAIPATLPPTTKGSPEIPKSFYYEGVIRAFLVSKGFSEVMTSSFFEQGSVAIEKPLAEDKKYARENLRGSFEKALIMNARNAPLFGKEETLIFEIGTIFTKGGEKTALAIGVAGPKKKIAGVLEGTIKDVSER
ncbi:MAG: phenylalanine--tRNA ligase subunit beta, partial [Candidatus Taylorbacteria bacterium]|nr:phenylalanine--tRNA ligase subunit beta [Candidatus Taylorbacteria bacterium]